MTKPLFETFRAAMMANPNGSRKEAQDKFLAEIAKDPAYLNLLAMDYFERMAAIYTVRGDANNHAFQRTEASIGKGERISAALSGKPKLVSRSAAVSFEEARQKRDDSAKRAAVALDDMKLSLRNVLLLDLVMPNGKTLRQSTGAECARAGGFYSEIAKHIKPTQVVDKHITEGDLQNIRARFYQSNSGNVAC